MPFQGNVFEFYQTVIDETMKNARKQLWNESKSNPIDLDILEKRWWDRLRETHDYSKDPQIISEPAGKRRKKSSHIETKETTNNLAVSVAAGQSSAVNGGLPIKALVNEFDIEPTRPPQPLSYQHDGSSTAGGNTIDQIGVQQTPIPQPAMQLSRLFASRPVATPLVVNPSTSRSDGNDDSRIEIFGENLDSSDGTPKSDNSDEALENHILAQYEKVRKNGNWKINLCNGIISIRGRDYFFHKAACNLEF